MTSFDRVQLLRACAYCGAALSATTAIVVLTDEPFSTLAWRVARIAAISPAIAVLGVFSAIARARTRGELQALEALGAHPLRARLGAILGGWLIGTLAVLALSAPPVDVRALFPSVTALASWHPIAGGLEAPALGVGIAATGQIHLLQATAAGEIPSPGHLMALCVVTPLLAVAPPWAAVSLSSPARAIGAGITAVATIVTFHALAAGRIPAFFALGAALPLAVQTVYGARQVARIA